MLLVGIIWFCVTVDYRAQIGGRYLLNALPYLVVLLGIGLRRDDSQGTVWTTRRQLLLTAVIFIFVAAVIAANVWWLLQAGRYYGHL